MQRLFRRFGDQALLVAIVLALGLALIYPILLTVRGGFAKDPATGEGWTLEHLRLLSTDPSFWGGLLNALKIACITTLLSIVIALPLALLAAGCRFPGKKLFAAGILVPLILPPFVGAIGMRAILGRQGALNAILGTEWDILGGRAEVLGIDVRLIAIALVQALHLYPIIYLNAVAALANLDPALGESAENLGAGPVRRFFRITLPLIRPGLFAGGTIVFIWSFTELGTPLMFDFYQVTPVQIVFGLKEVENSARPYALTVVLLASSVVLYVLGKFVFGGRGYAMYSKASRAADERTLGPLGGTLAAGAFGVVTLLALVPHIGVVLVSLSGTGAWYRSVVPEWLTLEHFHVALGERDSLGAIRNSTVLALGAVMVNLVLGLVIAYLIVRTRAKGRALLDALCMLPLAVPGLVMAFGYVAVTLGWPFNRALEIGWGGTVWVSIPAFLDGTIFDLQVLGTNPNPFPLLVIAYAVRRLPYIVRSTVAGLEQTSGELEEAAVNLGASRVTAVRKVIVPLIMANLIAGSLLVFSFSMLEVSDSLILAQKPEHYPITKAIFAFSERLGDGMYVASALGVWGMLLLAVTLVGSSVLLGKKLGAIFRV
ncbi:MAG: iron ABC transporter permease [Phycisphaerales bacterium]|nr:iron ABC transporter permease [Phycisphaerales bacterium]